MMSWIILATLAATSQAFFFGGGGGSACGCGAPPACPPPPPPAPCGGGGGGGYARAYSAPTAFASPPQSFAAGPSYQQAPMFAPIQPMPGFAAHPMFAAAAPASFGSSYAAPHPFAAQQPFAAPPSQPIVAPPQPVPAGGAYTAPHKRQANEDTGVDQSEGYRVKRDDEAVFDPKCNSEDLKAIIIANINESTAVAKRQIQSAAADAIGGRVDVICSKGTFSYIVNTELYCETEKDGTTCFAFKQSS